MTVRTDAYVTCSYCLSVVIELVLDKSFVGKGATQKQFFIGWNRFETILVQKVCYVFIQVCVQIIRFYFMA